MNRLPFILSAIALAVLAGCATESGITSAPAPVVAPAPRPQRPQRPPHLFGRRRRYGRGAAGQRRAMVVAPAALPLRVGFGRIDSILAIPNAAAGGSATSPTTASPCGWTTARRSTSTRTPTT